MKKIALAFAGILFALSFVFFKQPAKQPVKDARPNIVVILADDLGFSDIGCYGSEIHTPNIDYLAAHGIRYTRFYNTSRCCPTRASLLTGLYNQRAGIGNMTDAEDEPGYLGHLAENSVTLAEVLKGAGYHTAMSGKWHVSNTIGQKSTEEQQRWLNHQVYYPTFSPLAQYPTSRGFEKFFGTIWGVVDYYDPFSLVSGTTPIKTIPKNYYHTDAINDTTVSYIKEFSKDNKPFFLYVAENAPHWPLMAPPEDIAKYKDTYKVGWDTIRARRYNKLIKAGIIDPVKAPLSLRDKSGLKWDDNPDKAWDAAAMAVHAAMIDRMDQGIGRIIKALKESGKLDNTLIVFLSDNGASSENCTAYGPGFDRPNQTRAGEKIAYDMKKTILPGFETSYASIGERWANVANTPYRYWKAESYEGGVHTPMIAFWPKGVTVANGSLSNQLGHVKDFMATFVELAKTTYPLIYKGHPVIPTQGKSLAASFKGITKPDEALFNEHYGARYVRYNGWKLVSLPNDTTWNLYHIKDDETEINNQAGKYPEKVTQLSAMWHQWAVTNNVYPKPRHK
ncbi:arylsulfatase [Mucilaginibacter ginsenosidivorax]|uniref:Arylsulfatase n=1 Tax=Mucilaginibacter ginsenosidivorax TaxID=862126 RepID=A0A5B8VTH3_9SPHI|nr:arylsulfatase [Mucilaginibacter ginsenosidivorax]QEC74451.1 arylsulfatase [Mucilaginibacter ginsenosidivorax]